MMRRFFTMSASGALMAVAASGTALADENPAKHPDAQSGIPLLHYCNHVPDLSVDRPGSVETWVKICTVYFNARTNSSGPRSPADRPEKPPRERPLPEKPPR